MPTSPRPVNWAAEEMKSWPKWKRDIGNYILRAYRASTRRARKEKGKA